MLIMAMITILLHMSVQPTDFSFPFVSSIARAIQEQWGGLAMFPSHCCLPFEGVLPESDQRQGCMVFETQKQSAKQCLQSGKPHQKSPGIAC